MSDHGGNKTPRASTKDGGTKDPNTPEKIITQIELTPIESLLFFNMGQYSSPPATVLRSLCFRMFQHIPLEDLQQVINKLQFALTTTTIRLIGTRWLLIPT